MIKILDLNMVSYRSLINNMVIGVDKGHSKKLELRGVGYRASVQGDMLDISVGYSHNIIFQIPPNLKVTAETEKGKAPIISISGCDKQVVGAYAEESELKENQSLTKERV